MARSAIKKKTEDLFKDHPDRATFGSLTNVAKCINQKLENTNILQIATK
jgi:poly-D-alanine transfer protein DltD